MDRGKVANFSNGIPGFLYERAFWREAALFGSFFVTCITRMGPFHTVTRWFFVPEELFRPWKPRRPAPLDGLSDRANETLSVFSKSAGQHHATHAAIDAGHRQKVHAMTIKKRGTFNFVGATQFAGTYTTNNATHH